MITFKQGAMQEHGYVQKVCIEQDNIVFFFGDLHGDVWSLLNCLSWLRSQGHLSDDFVIKNPKIRLVFLGDYTGRTKCGIEILYLLFTLKLKNSAQVFLLRGNHESAALNLKYGFANELVSKLRLFQDSCIDLEEDIYNLLPAALCLGYPQDASAESMGRGESWMLCCHGGPEIGFSLRAFIKSKADFCAIKRLDQDFYIQQLPETLQNQIALADSSSLEVLSRARKFVFDNRDLSSKAQLGFLWNDFAFSPAEQIRRVNARGQILSFDLAKELLDRDGLQLVVRGHQHKGDFLQQLYSSGGLFSHVDGRVNTILSCNLDQSCRVFAYSFVSFSHKQVEGQSGWLLEAVYQKLRQE